MNKTAKKSLFCSFQRRHALGRRSAATAAALLAGISLFPTMAWAGRSGGSSGAGGSGGAGGGSAPSAGSNGQAGTGGTGGAGGTPAGQGQPGTNAGTGPGGGGVGVFSSSSNAYLGFGRCRRSRWQQQSVRRLYRRRLVAVGVGVVAMPSFWPEVFRRKPRAPSWEAGPAKADNCSLRERAADAE
jgi:hypothetical protein